MEGVETQEKIMSPEESVAKRFLNISEEALERLGEDPSFDSLQSRGF